MTLTPIKLNRFWRRVIVSEGCWEWTGCKERKGYGRLRIGGEKLLSHRFSWTLHRGEIPSGIQVCHSCDNPSCVNPDHLFLGTNQLNVLDKCRKGRQAKGENSGCAKLTASDVRKIISLRQHGNGHRKIARAFNVDHKTIGRILNGKGWLHITNPDLARDRFEIEVSKEMSKPATVADVVKMVNEVKEETFKLA